MTSKSATPVNRHPEFTFTFNRTKREGRVYEWVVVDEGDQYLFFQNGDWFLHVEWNTNTVIERVQAEQVSFIDDQLVRKEIVLTDCKTIPHRLNQGGASPRGAQQNWSADHRTEQAASWLGSGRTLASRHGTQAASGSVDISSRTHGAFASPTDHLSSATLVPPVAVNAAPKV